jgi:hypothetical protein
MDRINKIYKIKPEALQAGFSSLGLDPVNPVNPVYLLFSF